MTFEIFESPWKVDHCTLSMIASALIVMLQMVTRKPSCVVEQSTVVLVDRLVGLVVKASASGAEDPGFKSRLQRDFLGSSHTGDRLPCQAPGVIGSVLGLVGPVSGWGRKFDLQLLSQVWQHVQLSEQIRPWDILACCWGVKQPTNTQTNKQIVFVSESPSRIILGHWVFNEIYDILCRCQWPCVFLQSFCFCLFVVFFLAGQLRQCVSRFSHRSFIFEFISLFSQTFVCLKTIRPQRNCWTDCSASLSHDSPMMHGVTVSTSAFLACQQCYCVGSKLAWGLDLRALVAYVAFSEARPRGFLRVFRFPPLLHWLMVQPIKWSSNKSSLHSAKLNSWAVPSYHGMLHVLSARRVARDLHTTTPGPLDRTC